MVFEELSPVMNMYGCHYLGLLATEKCSHYGHIGHFLKEKFIEITLTFFIFSLISDKNLGSHTS